MIRFAFNKLSPIGLDIGYNSIKMLQFARNGDQVRIYAADKIQCVSEVGEDPDQRRNWIIDTIREIIKRGAFSGTRVISCLPNEKVKIKSLRIDPAETENIEELIHGELAERFKLDPEKDEIRYIPAGKVFHGSEIKQEVIFFTAAREAVESQIALLEEAGLIPEAIDPVPCSILRCHQRSMRREADQDVVRSFIDIGNNFTTVVVGSCRQVYFIKLIPAGGKKLNEQVGKKLGLGIEEAMLLRSKIQHGNTESINTSTRQAVIDSMGQCIEELAHEISMCFRYCAVTFRGHNPEEVVLTGGEAYESAVIDSLKRYLNVEVRAAQPLRGIELCNTNFVWDQQSPLCEWAVATGLGFKKWQINDYVSPASEAK